MRTTPTDLISLATAARAGAAQMTRESGEAPESVDALLAMDGELETYASEMIDSGWSRTQVRLAIEDGITQERATHSAAAALGSIRTPRKAKTSAENGKKGGRPTIKAVVAAADLDRIRAMGAEDAREALAACGSISPCEDIPASEWDAICAEAGLTKGTSGYRPETMPLRAAYAAGWNSLTSQPAP